MVIGRVLTKPSKIEVIEVANAYPPLNSPTFAAGKPQEQPGIPQGQVRASLGQLKAVQGSSVVVSNKLVPGFSGGPILDQEGKAIALSVTILNHFDKTSVDFPTLGSVRPLCWDESWGVGSSLVTLKPVIDDIVNRYGKR